MMSEEDEKIVTHEYPSDQYLKLLHPSDKKFILWSLFCLWLATRSYFDMYINIDNDVQDVKFYAQYSMMVIGVILLIFYGIKCYRYSKK